MKNQTKNGIEIFRYRLSIVRKICEKTVAVGRILLLLQSENNNKYGTNTKYLSLVMFNRAAQQGIAAAHNILDFMSSGDGKSFWGFSPDEEWFVRLMRK